MTTRTTMMKIATRKIVSMPKPQMVASYAIKAPWSRTMRNQVIAFRP